MATGLAGNNRVQTTTTERPSEHAELLDRVVEATRYSVKDVEVMAKRAAASRLFGMDENQAFTLMMIAESEGIHPIQAMKRYHVIHGRPTMRADAMQAEMQRRGWTVDWTSEDDDPNEQFAMWSHPKKQPTPKQVGFTRQQAEQAELKSDLWRKYPSNMLRARAIANAVRKFDPGIIVGIYTPEEATDFEPISRPEPELPQRPELAPIPAPRTERRTKFEPPATPYSEPIPNRSPLREWIDKECTRTKDMWANICLLENKEPTKTPPTSQIINHLLKAWIGKEVLAEEEICTDGKRDKFKIAQVMTSAWEEDEAEIKADVRMYLWVEVCKLAEAAGIEPPAQTEWTEE